MAYPWIDDYEPIKLTVMHVTGLSRSEMIRYRCHCCGSYYYAKEFASYDSGHICQRCAIDVNGSVGYLEWPYKEI